MSCLVTAKVEKLLLEGPLDAICSATVIYQTMNRNDLLPYEEVIKIVESAVKSSLKRIRDFQRKESVMEVLTEVIVLVVAAEGWGMPAQGRAMLLGTNPLDVEGFCSPLANKESTPDTTEEEIKKNIEMLNEKLKHPLGDDDGPLYSALKKTVENIVLSDLTWRDPVANMVLSDNSYIVTGLHRKLKPIFMDFLENFEVLSTHKIVENAKHDNKWKEDDSDLLKITGRILDVLGEIWSSPIYATSTSRNKQSEGTYITDVIVPLLRASLANLPNGYICTSIAERQSIASKIRKNKGIDGERIGKKPDIMGIMKQDTNDIELIYVESSRITCSEKKKDDYDVKLWREMIDGTSAINALCRPAGHEFGVVGIQIAGLDMRLNVLVKDLGGIPRYFHLDHAEIPISPHLTNTKSLIRVLLNLRNVMIVNKSLITQALLENPPRNTSQSTTVSTPDNSMYYNSNSVYYNSNNN
ncbi:uncharacterized protein OCT59_022815 [Rhizophagus irregularis]|uniref:uncharacterized protein n=1 Tax=Rhizophagus irregularis TaxID=588596 RepID=UPI00332EDE35|nr:hypothetical protein OCT59_022815 [Rhizophagus irregularis]